jgi:hypothetical protein
MNKIDKLIEILAAFFRKQLEKENLVLTICLIPIIMFIGIGVCIYEELE